jgi:2-iminobutanoate/2-iminopropanoate deaminase
MKKRFNLFSQLKSIFLIIASIIIAQGCNEAPKEAGQKSNAQTETHEYFNVRPEVEKAYGYTHAVKIGDEIKISGAVSMDDAGKQTAVGDLLQQMKNCYSDLDKVLKHYGCTFDDVVVENVFTTNMPEFLKQSGYRNTIYTKQFPTGSWLGVKELALPEFMIEIELEVHKAK